MSSDIEAGKIASEQKSVVRTPFLRESPPGAETTGGYYECLCCNARTPWDAGSILHAPDCPIIQKVPGADQISDRLLDATYEKLARIFVTVREPGKSALVIFLEEEQLAAFTQEVGGIDVFRQAIVALSIRGRVAARKMDYPSHIPEAWNIVFLGEEETEASRVWGLISSRHVPGRSW